MFDPANDETQNPETQLPDVAVAEDATPVEAAPNLFDWNGEIDALQKSDWFGRIEEPVRNSLVRGFEQKYRNFERGFSKAFQDTASRRRELDRKEATLRQQELEVQRWLTGDSDPIAAKQKEIDQIKAAHDAALLALREEYDQNSRKAVDEWSGKYSTLEQEREQYRQRVEQIEYQAQVEREQQVEAAVTDVETWLTSEAKDVYENDDAFYMFCVLCTGGADPEDAVTMVRAKYGAPATPEPLPADLAMSNMGANRTATTEQADGRSYKEIMDAMRRAAQSES
jgi:hypothetical protein